MNEPLHPLFQKILAPFAPPALTDADRAEIDAAMLQDKQPLPGNPLTDAREQRRQNNALRLQMNDQTGYYK